MIAGREPPMAKRTSKQKKGLRRNGRKKKKPRYARRSLRDKRVNRNGTYDSGLKGARHKLPNSTQFASH